MIARKPPALATRLLNWLHFPELAGDLDEEFQAGRSRTWYWRQTIAAITTRVPPGQLTAILLGWATQASVALYIWRLVGWERSFGDWRTGVALGCASVLIRAGTRYCGIRERPNRMSNNDPVLNVAARICLYDLPDALLYGPFFSLPWIFVGFEIVVLIACLKSAIRPANPGTSPSQRCT